MDNIVQTLKEVMDLFEKLFRDHNDDDTEIDTARHRLDVIHVQAYAAAEDVKYTYRLGE